MCGRSSHGAAPHAGPEGEPVRMARAGRRPRGGCRSTSSEPKHPPALCDDPVRVIGRLRRSCVWLFSVLSPPLPPPQRGFRILEKQLCLGFGAHRGPRTMGNLLCRKEKKRENAADSAIIHLHLRRKFPLSSSIDAAFFSKPPTRREGRARARTAGHHRSTDHVNGGRGASEGDRG